MLTSYPFCSSEGRLSQPPRMIRVGDIVMASSGNGVREFHPDLGGNTGIVIDEMEMEDGFFMFEVLIGSDVYWFDSIELKLLEKE